MDNLATETIILSQTNIFTVKSLHEQVATITRMNREIERERKGTIIVAWNWKIVEKIPTSNDANGIRFNFESVDSKMCNIENQWIKYSQPQSHGYKKHFNVFTRFLSLSVFFLFLVYRNPWTSSLLFGLYNDIKRYTQRPCDTIQFVSCAVHLLIIYQENK